MIRLACRHFCPIVSASIHFPRLPSSSKQPRPSRKIAAQLRFMHGKFELLGFAQSTGIGVLQCFCSKLNVMVRHSTVSALVPVLDEQRVLMVTLACQMFGSGAPFGHFIQPHMRNGP